MSHEIEFGLESDGELAEIIRKHLRKRLKKKIKILALTFSARYRKLSVFWDEVG